MLFAVKRHAATALGAGAVVAFVAVVAHSLLELSWSLRPTPRALALGVAGCGVVLLSDGLLHLVLRRLGGAYRGAYQDLLGYFDGQSAGAMVAGGVEAGAEELLFRGVVLQGAVQLAGLPVAVAVAVAAVLFGAAHVDPAGRVRVFSLWAVWEGLLLGSLYVVTGSLLVAVVAHALHDVAGFALFARERRLGEPHRS